MGPIRSSSQKEQSSQLAPYSVQPMKNPLPRSQSSNTITAYFSRAPPSTLSQLTSPVISPLPEPSTSNCTAAMQCSPLTVGGTASEALSQRSEMTAGKPNHCILCNISGSELLKCHSCSSYYHAGCAGLGEVPTGCNWQCSICKIASDTTFQSCYRLLADNAASPLAPVLAYLCKEITGIRQQLSLKPVCPDQEMTGNVETAKPKRVILIGNDVRGMKPIFRDLLNEDSRFCIISHTDKDIGLLLDEAKTLVEADAHEHLIKLILHPGVHNCQLLQGERLLAQMQNFGIWLASAAPNVELNVVSIPQVIKHECQSVNDGLEKMAGEGLLRFIPLTVLQSKMLITGSTSYCSDTARNISSVLARYIARFLQVSIRKLKKQKDASKVSPVKAGKQPQAVKIAEGARVPRGRTPRPRSSRSSSRQARRPSYRTEFVDRSSQRMNPQRLGGVRHPSRSRRPQQVRVSDFVPHEFNATDATPGRGAQWPPTRRH